MFEDALAGVAAGAAGKFGIVVGVDRDRSGRCAARPRRRRRRLGPRRAARARVIAQAAFAVEPWCIRETRARPRSARTDRVGLRPLERTHRPAREPGRGRAVRHARDVPELVLRAAAAAARRGRLRLSGIGADDRQRHGRQDHAPARRRRAVRRPLREAALARARARPARGRAAPDRRLDLSCRRHRARVLDQARLVRAARGRGDPLRGRGDRRPAARRRAVGAPRERAGRRADLRSARRRRARVAAAPGGLVQPRPPERCCSTRPSRATCGWARRWIT